MAYIANVYQGDHIAAQDLQNIEGNFEYLRTNFLGPGAPPDPGGGLEGVVWWDDANLTLKVRDGAAWRGVFSGDATFKIWAYLPSGSVPDGWTRDATVSDEVLAFEGGAVYTTGAQRDKGTWTISGLTKDEHTHSSSHYHAISATTGGKFINVGPSPGFYTDTRTTGNVGQSDAGVTHSPGWRIKAAVGILLYPKM